MEAIKPTETSLASIQETHFKRTEYHIEAMCGTRSHDR